MRANYNRITIHWNRHSKFITCCAVVCVQFCLLRPCGAAASEHICWPWLTACIIIPIRANYSRIAIYRNWMSKKVKTCSVCCNQFCLLRPCSTAASEHICRITLPLANYNRITIHRNRISEIVIICAVWWIQFCLLRPCGTAASEHICRTWLNIITPRTNYSRITIYRNWMSEPVSWFAVWCVQFCLQRPCGAAASEHICWTWIIA